jgi:hypothetical protein
MSGTVLNALAVDTVLLLMHACASCETFAKAPILQTMKHHYYTVCTPCSMHNSMRALESMHLKRHYYSSDTEVFSTCCMS